MGIVPERSFPKILFSYACQSDAREKSRAEKRSRKRSRDERRRHLKSSRDAETRGEPNEARTKMTCLFLLTRKHPSLTAGAARRASSKRSFPRSKNKPPAEGRARRARARAPRSLLSSPTTSKALTRASARTRRYRAYKTLRREDRNQNLSNNALVFASSMMAPLRQGASPRSSTFRNAGSVMTFLRRGESFGTMAPPLTASTSSPPNHRC